MPGLIRKSSRKKSNEITEIPKILEALSIDGCVVSIDEMGCQKSIAKDIQDRSGDYVLALTGNQGKLHAEVDNFFVQSEAIDFEYVNHDRHTSCEENRGRKEKRILYVTEEIDRIPGKEEWSGLKSIVSLISHREFKGKKQPKNATTYRAYQKILNERWCQKKKAESRMG